MPDQVLYTAEVISTGDGRAGHVLSSDHRLDLDLSVPPELDGPGGPGTNPEQLFAAGYAACFHSALRGLARQAGVDASHSTVTAQVGVGPEGDMYGLVVTLVISVPSLDQAATRELAEAAHQRCPYSRATRGNISVELRALLAKGDGGLWTSRLSRPNVRGCTTPTSTPTGRRAARAGSTTPRCSARTSSGPSGSTRGSWNSR
ncbi:MAG TPA: organic hydroperoxide resistance protein [Streptosporangiaceae bacterium]|nr:organic hydroperoxide resistance protein [Streptosporangiaceae bacterium]HJY99845.1 organic hydroperoxide resistance protein [Streptosporangiaceae bacterium]